jgi:type I restriction enzyme S subunit
LDGLEAVEMKLSEVLNGNDSFRFDSEFFGKKYLKNSIKLSALHTKKLCETTLKIDVGFVGSMTEHYRDEGVPLLQTKNIASFLVDATETVKITKEFHAKLVKSKINFEDILIARSGSFGKASIYLQKESVNSSDIIIINADKSVINPYFLTVYLNSNIGMNQMIRFASGGVQGHVNLTILESLTVPMFSDNFQLIIETVIKEAYKTLETSKRLYTQAETLLLKTLGLDNFTSSTQSVNIKSFKDSFGTTGRLDAEYYQPKYESYEQMITAKQHTVISNEYIHVTTTSKKDKEGYNYIEIGDVNVGDGSHKSNYVLAEDLPANAKILVKKGDILISNVRPYRGAVTIIDKENDNLIVSGAFTVLRTKEKSIFNAEVLKVLLRSRIYKDWLLKFNIGTSYPVIKDADVLNMPIPLIDIKIQTQIADLVQQSFALKKESEQLLEKAKQAVELAIEQGEDVAMDFLNDLIKRID